MGLVRDWWNGEPHYRTYTYRSGPDTIKFKGEKLARTYELGNWDIARERILYRTPDGTFTLKESIHDIGVYSSYEHGLTVDDVRERFPRLAYKARLGKVKEI